MKYFIIQIILVFFFINFNVFAQNYAELAKIGYQYSPNNKYQNSDDKADVGTGYFSAKLPKIFKNGDILFAGINGDLLNFNFKSSSGNDLHFNSIALQFGFNHKWNEKLNSLFVLIPRLSPAFKKTPERDFQLGAILMLLQRVNDNFQLKYGVFISNEYYGPYILPIVGFNWKINEKSWLYGNLPVDLFYSYQINKRLYLGVAYIASSGTYRYPDAPYDYLSKGTLEFDGFADVYITKNIALNLKAGHTFGRDYQQFNADDKIDLKLLAFLFGDNRIQLNDKIKQGFLFEACLSFRIPTQTKKETSEK